MKLFEQKGGARKLKKLESLGSFESAMLNKGQVEAVQPEIIPAPEQHQEQKSLFNKRGMILRKHVSSKKIDFDFQTME